MSEKPNSVLFPCSIRDLTIFWIVVLIEAFVKNDPSGSEEILSRCIVDSLTNEHGDGAKFVRLDNRDIYLAVVWVEPFAIILAFDAKRSVQVAVAEEQEIGLLPSGV